MGDNTIMEYEVEVWIEKEVFYNNDTLHGIYACNPVNYDKRFIRTSFGSIAIQGQTHRLIQDGKYKMKLEGPHNHKKYGIFYKILAVESEKLETANAQEQFLKVIITENQLSALKAAYPHEKLVDFILADKVNTAMTKGIKAESLKTIKARIKANLSLAELITVLNQLDISTNRLTKILQHFGRSAMLALETIENDIYELCNIKSFGFKTVDEMALKRGDDPNSKERIEACLVYYIKKDIDTGHSWSIKSEILDVVSETLGLSKGIVESTLINMSSNKIFQNDIQVALTHTRQIEKMILQHLLRIHQSYIPPDISVIASRLNQTEMAQGFKFTEEQRKVIIEGSQHGVIILNGLAGAGKTATVKGIIDSLDKVNYMTAALSGKAVNILSQRNIEASTIHRMLGFIGGKFEHNETDPLSYQVIVLDEMSMNDALLVYSVVSAIRTGAKLILVGDSGQLPAIGFGDVLRDLLATNLFPKYELTQVHRQAAKSGILMLANSIRKGIQPLSYNEANIVEYGEANDQTLFAYRDKKEILSGIIEIAESYKEKIKAPEDHFDFQVIVSNKERGELSVKNLNIRLQEVFNGGNKPSIKTSAYEFKEGDKIITKGNVYNKLKFPSTNKYFEVLNFVNFTDINQVLTYEQQRIIKPYVFDLFNGTLGYIDKIARNGSDTVIFIRLEGHEGVIALDVAELDKIDMAYAATVHRLQGSSIKNVVFALDFGSYKLLSKQLVYTALTRASEKGKALVETNALHTAIKTDASNSRRTFLQEFINEMT
ncbi:AAA family ATPase [Solibacillus sp. FSL H8-0523]|uniref:AAA family ATPase n=1 Tax=Solibacillus sp. FSL H8-0523 TaxID=2954511 RepID=UPI003100C001